MRISQKPFEVKRRIRSFGHCDSDDSDRGGRFIGIAIEIAIEIARLEGEVDSDSDRDRDFDALSRGADKSTPPPDLTEDKKFIAFPKQARYPSFSNVRFDPVASEPPGDKHR